MVSRAVTFRKADLARTIEVFQKKGIAIGGVDVLRDGFRLLTAQTASPVDDEEAELAAYRAGRDARGES